MSFVKGVRLLQMLLIENPALRIAEKLLTDLFPNPIICRIAENRCQREQQNDDREIQRILLSGQSSDGEQK